MALFRCISFALCALTFAGAQEQQRNMLRRTAQGSAAANGECPLKRTTVHAEISGMVSRVTVVQEFTNPFGEHIEAVYTFPLPHRAAVDRMTMLIEDRRIRGSINTRSQARLLYENAKASGRVASRLDGERPNVFTQYVANVPPGSNIRIELSYFQLLEYDTNQYQFSFPMVVGPRYIPEQVKPDDAARISPPVRLAVEHDLKLEVVINAGLAIGDITSSSHAIDVHRTSASEAQVRLRNGAEVPDRDFTLSWSTPGRTVQTSVLSHRSESGGFFTAVVQPPTEALAADFVGRELIFVLDTSGSMSGRPIEKSKDVIRLALRQLTARDTFNLITFSGDTDVLLPAPAPGSPENIAVAELFLNSRTGGGGTEMMKAIATALQPAGETGRLRIVCFMTDGYVGNDLAILGEVRKHPQARVFAFGIGSSVNRFLLDGMAQEGRGDVEYVGLDDDAKAAVDRFVQRVREPILTDIHIDWKDLPVSDVYPKRIPDLFSAKPIILTGRYRTAAKGVASLRGVSGQREMEIPLSLDLPESEPANPALVAWWANGRVADLISQDYAGMQNGNPRSEIAAAIENTGLTYGIVTPLTSFIAVEERVVTFNGESRRVDVPVAVPHGVTPLSVGMSLSAHRHGGIGSGAGVGYAPGSGAGTGGGVYQISGGVAAPFAISKVEPEYTEEARAAGLRGSVLLAVTIGEDGIPRNVRIIRPLGRGLDEKALEAVRKWRFRPAIRDGKPVPTSANVEVSFPPGTGAARGPELTPEIANKLGGALIEVLRNARSQSIPVLIQLRDDSEQVITKLKEAGLTLASLPNDLRQVRGAIESGRLVDLAAVPAVRYVVPATR